MRRVRPLLGLLIPLAAACSGDDAATTDDSATTAATSMTTTASTGTATGPGTDGTSTSTETSGGTMTATGTSTTSEPTSTTDPTATTSPTTTSTTEPTSTSTTEPGTTGTTDPTTGVMTDSDTTDGTTGDLFCAPGSSVCADGESYQVCDDLGEAYGDPIPCADGEGCSSGVCYGLCELAELEPSSVGCSFLANRMDNLHANQPDSLIVGNVSDTLPATVQLYFVADGQNNEAAQGAPVVVPPNGTHTFTLSNAQIESITTIRKGGVYRAESSIPVVAYLHSPIGSQATNDASMLLPEHALTGNYVVASYAGTFPTHYPSYFTAIATEDGTTLHFKAGIATKAGGGVPALAKGGETDVALQRFDTLNVVVDVDYTDLSGTIISADKPVWLVGATECGNVPMYPTTFCDHLEEVSIPLEYWGEKYVGAHAPKRGNETYYWRVYSGDDNVTVTTTPAQPGFPIVLDRGEYYQFGTKESFIFDADGPIMPVQYLEGQNGGAGTGDPSMYQMVPVEQFLSSYAFVTGTNYTQHFAQIIRPTGGPDVMVDNVVVTGYTAVGAYEVADWKISEGAHFATSDGAFGVIQVGYTNVTSYAYPGGLKLKVINPQ